MLTSSFSECCFIGLGSRLRRRQSCRAVTGGINWASIAGGFGVGAILAAVVTTYSGKGRERRRARSKALAWLMEIKVTRRTLPPPRGSYSGLLPPIPAGHDLPAQSSCRPQDKSASL